MKGLDDFGGFLGPRPARLAAALPPPHRDPLDLLRALGHQVSDAGDGVRLHDPNGGLGVAARVVPPEAFERPWAPTEPAAWTLTTDGRRWRLAPDGAWFRCLLLDAEQSPGLLAPLLGPAAFGWGPAPGLWRRPGRVRDRVHRAARAALEVDGSSPRALVSALARRQAPFADLPLEQLHPDVLGRVYEAALGAVRKRRGSYYTPRALARALVDVGLGPACEEAQTVEDVERLRVLDPAAGGGQVLLAALERLTQAWVARAPGDEPLDLTALRRRLATRCLAAADLDADALEVARLALASLAGDLELALPDLRAGDALLEVHAEELDAALPPDAQAPTRDAWLAAVDAGRDGRAEAAALERARAAACARLDALAAERHGERRAIHWRRLFPGGFDVVLGNPPYHRETSGSALFADVRRARLGRHARSKGDLWFFFTHLALELLRPGGRHAFVVPGYWLKATGAGPRHLREALRPLRWTALIDLGRLPVFRAPGGRRVAGRHVVFAVRATGQAATQPPVPVYAVAPGPVARRLRALRNALARGASAPGVTRREVTAAGLRDPDGKLLLALGLTVREHALLRRLRREGGDGPDWRISEGVTANPDRVTARALARVRAELGVDLGRRGVAVGDPVFLLPADWPELASLDPEERRRLVPFLHHERVDRLRARPAAGDPWLIYTTRETAPALTAIPRLGQHLARAREIMELRRETRRGRRAWFQLHWPRHTALLEGPRVLVPRMTTWPAAALADARCAVGESVYTIVPEDRAAAPLLAALLNALPFALGILLTTKPRGRGVDIPKAALTGCPWPSAAELADPPAPLREAQAAAGRLAALAPARAHTGPWWSHPDPAVAEAGRALDEAVCAWLDLPYRGLRALAERRPC